MAKVDSKRVAERARIRLELRIAYQDQSNYIRKCGKPCSKRNRTIEGLRIALKRIDKRSIEAEPEETMKKTKQTTPEKERPHKKIIGVCVCCRERIYSKKNVYEYQGAWYCSRNCRDIAIDAG
ncbi:hypothetical protein MKX34_11590 [Paenibacillus sp. FSL R5-0636]|uniref:FLZ-type domain-containing protein n=1 Tax=Paenibacillus odorifer TaxID=189426 RepID=A0AB36J5D9_9BACL|nr:hypothetical protein [Paenibacillus odorifer]OMD04704.1 hypothetical protein BJP49_22805 [Paenibacillus odorifer]OME09601.1 hypothetical protein BSK60_27595 [Paenibacillus odorifer]OME10420.1 hypothetical protein BSK47_30815 [Paenibacillus odorifer]